MYRSETYGELSPHIEREWLLTNGTGSFAMSTAVGCNTRRYHGLLVAATLPPVGRILALSRVAESISIDNEALPVELSINRFGDLHIPRGDRYLRRFELSDIASFDYDADGVRITKQILLAWGKPLVGIRYQLDPGSRKRAELRLMPFVALRDFHALLHKGQTYDLTSQPHALTVGLNGHRLHLAVDRGQFTERPDWWYDHTYAIETERGMEDREDLFTPGTFSFEFSSPGSVTLWASMQPFATQPNGPLPDFDAERVRAEQARALKSMPTPTQNRLVRAAEQFICKRNRPGGSQGATILAGFPWFADWGRDTMISLPGLLLSTGRHQQAGQVLSVFAGHVSRGMIPNLFDDYTNEPTYNTVDASLWFVHAAHQYLRITRDRELFESLLLPACQEIIAGYRDGTRYDIRMDPADGLISSGSPGTQLTWMDAKMGDIVFTPRHGKAVEINALWYNALCLLNETELANRVKESFVKTFWVSPFRGLADVVLGQHRDSAIRPNQIFAASLPHSPLTLEQQFVVVEVVKRELLTPVGLRTLAVSEPGYRGRYEGNQFYRDRAYHNGTVWPWLIGHFLDAYLRVHKNNESAREQARAWLRPLIDSLETACIGSISECFEGDAPHRPVAASAQAWSVAEVLRLAVELEL